ncbi:ORF104R [Largemouth bass ulcerative syndrome virus]|nr:ORF104R [Largemouth bass ulcerative syndrome virus]
MLPQCLVNAALARILHVHSVIGQRRVDHHMDPSHSTGAHHMQQARHSRGHGSSGEELAMSQEDLLCVGCVALKGGIFTHATRGGTVCQLERLHRVVPVALWQQQHWAHVIPPCHVMTVVRISPAAPLRHINAICVKPQHSGTYAVWLHQTGKRIAGRLAAHELCHDNSAMMSVRPHMAIFKYVDTCNCITCVGTQTIYLLR